MTASSSPSTARPLLDEAGITLLDLSAATDTNAFMVTKEYSDANGVTKLSDLEGVSVKLAAAPDCEGRLDCEGGLTDQYGIDVTEVLPLGYASDQTYQSVLSGESELGETSTTDGTLESQGLVVLEDDKQIQPAQNLVPAVSAEFLSAHPDIADILNPLMAALTTENLTELNSRIAVDREKPEDVAKRLPHRERPALDPRLSVSGALSAGRRAARCSSQASQSRWPPGPITRRARFARRSLRSSIEWLAGSQRSVSRSARASGATVDRSRTGTSSRRPSGVSTRSTGRPRSRA